jgi:hypothetical protein
MKDYDKDNMPETVVKNLGHYLDDPANAEMLAEEKVKNASVAVLSML